LISSAVTWLAGWLHIVNRQFWHNGSIEDARGFLSKFLYLVQHQTSSFRSDS
jgi:hypothetical protein